VVSFCNKSKFTCSTAVKSLFHGRHATLNSGILFQKYSLQGSANGTLTYFVPFSGIQGHLIAKTVVLNSQQLIALESRSSARWQSIDGWKSGDFLLTSQSRVPDSPVDYNASASFSLGNNHFKLIFSENDYNSSAFIPLLDQNKFCLFAEGSFSGYNWYQW
jgi:hypothetical protein